VLLLLLRCWQTSHTNPARLALFFFALISVASTARSADNIVGRASVIDGDTLEIHGTRIRLHGIDAPEANQTCLVKKKPSRCGQQAAKALADRIGQQTVTCDPRDRDQYGRVVAVCSAGGDDLNAWMVISGMALAYRQYSTDYARQEKVATKRKIGVWRGAFVKPWEWRRGRRLTQDSDPDNEACTIKGNITRNGKKIYHVPGGQYYGPARIDISNGERWFCNEADARKAGWRKSRR